MTQRIACRDILLALSLCLSLAGAVQAADCKYAENSIDKITSARIVTTKPVQLTHWMRELRREMTAFVAASSYGGGEFLRLNIEYVRDRATEAKRQAGANAIVIPQGAELMIAMSDGAVLKLQASKAVAGDTTNDDPHPDWFTTRATIDYAMDASSVDALAAQGAKALRVMTDTGHYDVKIHKSNVDDIRKAIECVR